MALVIHVVWECHECDVGETQPETGEAPLCWNCGGPVIITARPALNVVQSAIPE